MNTKMQRAVCRVMLASINCGKMSVTIAKLKEAADDDEFSSKDMEAVLLDMLDAGFINVEEDGQLDITADIAAVRNYVLNCEERDNNCGNTEKIDKETVLDSEWSLCDGKKEDENKGNRFNRVNSIFGGASDDLNSAAEISERRRRELIRQIEESEDVFDWADFDEDDSDEECLKKDALRFAVQCGTVSVALLKARFPIGYVKACKLIDWMTNNRYISSPDNDDPPKVLVGMNDLERIFGRDDYENDEDDVCEGNGDTECETEDSDGAEEDSREFIPAVRSLTAVLSRIAQIKNSPVTTDKLPSHSLWAESEFEDAVCERLEKIITSDKSMGRRGALKKAENYLEAVRDTDDRRMTQVYERIVYEFKNASDYIYRQIKKQVFNEGE